MSLQIERNDRTNRGLPEFLGLDCDGDTVEALLEIENRGTRYLLLRELATESRSSNGSAATGRFRNCGRSDSQMHWKCNKR